MTPEEQNAYDALAAQVDVLQADVVSANRAAADANASLSTSQQSASRLARDHRVWAEAFADCQSVAVRGPRENDSVANLVELIARASLTDSIALVCDGARSGLEAHVVLQIRAILGDSEVGTVLGKLEAIRQADSDTAAPTGVVARTRTAVRDLSEIAQNLPDGSEPRKRIATILNAQIAPSEHEPDTLFRMLVEQTNDTAIGFKGLGAVHAIRAAFRAQGG